MRKTLAEKKANAAARQRRYRTRYDEGTIVVPLELGWQEVDMLVREGWVKPASADSKDRARIGQEIKERLTRSARR
jgi:hypothetical protein